MEENLFGERTPLQEFSEILNKLKSEIGKVIVGQGQMIELLIAGILADGHVLIEGVPGVAKTLTAKLLSRSIDVGFSRIQFTPDLMPGDVIGTSIFNPREMLFQFRPGPIFSNIVLIDEINRAPAKTQAALFEVMEERQITVDGQTMLMSQPFLVIATQNPIEQEGTYHLPEAQLDRFLFKIKVDYPSESDEVLVVTKHHNSTVVGIDNLINPVLNAAVIENLRRLVSEYTCRRETDSVYRICGSIHETAQINLSGCVTACFYWNSSFFKSYCGYERQGFCCSGRYNICHATCIAPPPGAVSRKGNGRR